MTLEDLRFIFNRAFRHSFTRKKWVLVTGVLALCGLLVVFCRALAINAGDWFLMSLTFLPIFLCAGILLATGIFLVRIYHDEIKKKGRISYSGIVSRSWEVAVGASYFSVPIILAYLLMWVVLGVFYLFKEIPTVGDLFSVLLVLGPFLINLGCILLCVLSLGMLFFVTPVVALKTIDPIGVSQIIVRRVGGDVFGNVLLAVVATLPLVTMVVFLILAAFLTGTTYVEAEGSLHIVLQWFFMMLPFTALLSPPVIFFFNFAAEAHVLMRKYSEEGVG